MLSTEQEVVSLQNKIKKICRERSIVYARLYDLTFKGKEEPKEAELKAQIVHLEMELRRVTYQRDQLKTGQVRKG